jgi:hypothetical protein
MTDKGRSGAGKKRDDREASQSRRDRPRGEERQNNRPTPGAGRVVLGVIGGVLILAGASSLFSTLGKFAVEEPAIVFGRLFMIGLLCLLGFGLLSPLLFFSQRTREQRRHERKDESW